MIVLIGAAGTAVASEGNRFSRLDSLIAEQPRIIAEKEERLLHIKAELGKTTDSSGRYAVLKRLYDEYSAYQYDSAYAYVTESLKLAQMMGNERLVNESRLNLAHILSTACLMDKAVMTLNQIDTARLTTDQLFQYYRIKTNLLIFEAEYMQGTQYADEYVNQLIDIRRLVSAIDMPHDDVNHQLTVAESLADSRQHSQAIELLTRLMSQYKSGDRMYSVIASTMSFRWGTRTSRCNTSSRAPRATWKVASEKIPPCER